METTISELLKNSFDLELQMPEDGMIELPERLLLVMGAELQGDFIQCGFQRRLLVSRAGDPYFGGEPLTLFDGCLMLSQAAMSHLRVGPGDSLSCQYNGVGEYFTIIKKLPGPLWMSK